MSRKWRRIDYAQSLMFGSLTFSSASLRTSQTVSVVTTSEHTRRLLEQSYVTWWALSDLSDFNQNRNMFINVSINPQTRGAFRKYEPIAHSGHAGDVRTSCEGHSPSICHMS